MSPLMGKEAEVHGGSGAGDENIPVEASNLPTGQMETCGRAFRFPSDRVLRMLTVQALFLQLRDPKFRDDFCSGKVFPKHSSQHLSQLDLLSAACLPQWSVGVGFAEQLQQSSINFEQLITRSSKMLVLKGETSAFSKSYSDWFSIVYKLAQSKYWSGGSMKSECPVPIPVSNAEGFSSSDINPIKSVSILTEDPVNQQTLPINKASSALGNPESAAFNSKLLCEGSSLDKTNPSETQPQETISILSFRVSSGLEEQEICSGVGHSRDGGVRSGSNVMLKTHARVKSSNSFQPLFTPVCSGCGGDHLGIVCWKRKQHCHWCGRMGHSEEVCWRKTGACLICGCNEHRLRQCPRFIPMSAPVFPPWCKTCGSTHMGTNCEDPYME